MHESENILNKQLDNEQEKKTTKTNRTKKIELIRQKTQKRTNFEIAKIEILKIKQRLQNLRQRRIQKKNIEICKNIDSLMK